MEIFLSKAVVVSTILVLAACSEAPKTAAPETEAKKEAAIPAEPVTAKTAFWQMYKPAHTWAADLLPLSLANNEVPEMKSEDGKAPMWTAVFVSPSRHEARTFSYSVVDSGASIRKGVTMGGTQPWSGPTAKSRPFQTNEFGADSDAAYKAAYVKAESWVKKHPDKKAAFSLGNAARFPAPVWYVLWGNEKSGYAAFVNAVTGTVIK